MAKEHESTESRFVITDEQLTAMQSARDDKFIEWLKNNLRSRDIEGVRAMDDAALVERIKNGMELARKYRITKSRPTATFVELTLTVGPNFYLQTDIRQILTSPFADGEEKIASLLRDITPEQWFQASLATDA